MRFLTSGCEIYAQLRLINSDVKVIFKFIVNQPSNQPSNQPTSQRANQPTNYLRCLSQPGVPSYGFFFSLLNNLFNDCNFHFFNEKKNKNKQEINRTTQDYFVDKSFPTCPCSKVKVSEKGGYWRKR